MRPAPQQVLFTMFLRASEIGAEEGETYLGSELRIVFGALSALLSFEVERAVPVALEEAAALRVLLDQGAGVAPDDLAGALRTALQQTQLPTEPSAYALSALEARLAVLQRAFIDLQAWLEEHAEAEPALALLETCWAELAAGAARKAVPLPV